MAVGPYPVLQLREGETRSFEVDVGPGMRAADTIRSVTVTAPDGLTVADVSHTDVLVRFQASGGMPGASYALIVEWMTEQDPAQRLEARVTLIVVPDDAGVDLSPWPTLAGAARPAALALADAIGGTADRADNLGRAASALVERTAPGAPQAIRNEAVIRAAGWLRAQPAASVTSATVGPLATTYAAGQKGAMRHSGALSLLSPWTVRRAGRIG